MSCLVALLRIWRDICHELKQKWGAIKSGSTIPKCHLRSLSLSRSKSCDFQWKQKFAIHSQPFWQCRKVNMVFRCKYCEMISVLVLEYTVCFQINRTSEIMLYALKTPAFSHLFEVDFSKTYLTTSAENSVSEPPNSKTFWGRCSNRRLDSTHRTRHTEICSDCP